MTRFPLQPVRDLRSHISRVFSESGLLDINAQQVLATASLLLDYPLFRKIRYLSGAKVMAWKFQERLLRNLLEEGAQSMLKRSTRLQVSIKRKLEMTVFGGH